MEQDYHTFVMPLDLVYFHILDLSVLDVLRESHLKNYAMDHDLGFVRPLTLV
jgi:hypothetical protein